MCRIFVKGKELGRIGEEGELCQEDKIKKNIMKFFFFLHWSFRKTFAIKASYAHLGLQKKRI